MKKVAVIALFVFLGLALQGCGKGVVTITSYDFDRAFLVGKDSKGKTKEQYLLEVEDKRVKVVKPFVTKGGQYTKFWILNLGGNIMCSQESREAKEMVSNLKSAEPAAIVGEYKIIITEDGGALVLKDCYLEQ